MARSRRTPQEVPSGSLSAIQQGKRRAVEETPTSLATRQRVSLAKTAEEPTPVSPLKATTAPMNMVGRARRAAATTALVSADTIGSWKELRATPVEFATMRPHLEVARQAYEEIR